MKYRYLDSPFGRVLVAGDGDSLQWLSFTRGRQKATLLSEWTEDNRNTLLREAGRELDAYFAGKRERFALPLEPQGTAFQKRVWKKLVSIPYGKTVSYSELARRIGRRVRIAPWAPRTGKIPSPSSFPVTGCSAKTVT